MSFFILGLPRSRTAWLANFMTYEGTFCYHEGINGCHSVEEYKAKLGYNKGDSSTGAMLLDLDKHFPDAKKVIIESDINRAIEYSEELTGNPNEDWMMHTQARLYQLKGLRVEFDYINDSLKAIWEYLTDTEYDENRANMLLKLNIQVQDPYSHDLEAAKGISNEFI
jgi:hypothetical protein